MLIVSPDNRAQITEDFMFSALIPLVPPAKSMVLAEWMVTVLTRMAANSQSIGSVGLKAYTEYFVSVLLGNDAGQSEWSDEVSMRTASA